MRRREALKLIAASVPILAATGLAGTRDAMSSGMGSIKSLNVLFEGPFVFVFNGPNAEAMAPAVPGHVYLVGGMPAVQGTYSLAGIGGAGDLIRTRFDLPRGAEAFRCSARQLRLTLNTSKVPAFKFVLPVPDRVLALLSREAQIVDVSGNTTAALMPTTYAFIYHVTSTDELAVCTSFGQQQQIDTSQPGFANLVVAAGLPHGVQDPTGHHAQTAFAEAASYFGLNIQILSLGSAVRTGDIEGLPQELRNGLAHAKGGRQPRLIPAGINDGADRSHLQMASYITDCEAGGVIVTKP